MNIKAYPKIFESETKYVQDIFEDEVEITEKVDGSQFNFGKIDSTLELRSKGAELYLDKPESLFEKAIDYVKSIESKLPNDLTFFCEYFRVPQQNTIKYSRTPRNNLMLFGISDKSQNLYNHDQIKHYANLLDIEAIPLLYIGKLSKDPSEFLNDFLNCESILGGSKIEGIVIKNYSKTPIIGGQVLPVMASKLVSEEFKEVHKERWGTEETTKGKMETFFDSFKTEARWDKAIQHLKESGLLVNTPKDIGILLKEIETDIIEEETEAIKDFLYSEFICRITRTAMSGFPEYYKSKLK